MKVIEKIKQYGDIELDVPLDKYTTYRIGGIAKCVIHPKNEMGLTRILEICEEMHTPYKIFGKGSNLLCSNAYFDGVVIVLSRYFNEFSFESDGRCFAQAGVSLILLANHAMKHALSGLEFASGIPGTIGGAIKMNAGAYRSDMASVVKRVYVLKDHTCVWLDRTELLFAYRNSVFQEHPEWIVLGVELQLEVGNQEEIEALIVSRRQRRRDSQPLEKPSAGSVFRNPGEMSAWELIEGCGLRGYQIGGAMISEKHANFIVNENQASAKDVQDLIEFVQTKVMEKYNVHLKPEIERFNW